MNACDWGKNIFINKHIIMNVNWISNLWHNIKYNVYRWKIIHIQGLPNYFD